MVNPLHVPVSIQKPPWPIHPLIAFFLFLQRYTFYMSHMTVVFHQKTKLIVYIVAKNLHACMCAKRNGRAFQCMCGNEKTKSARKGSDRS